MSDRLAVAAVTATLQVIVQEAANAAVGETEVRLGAPTAKLAETTVPTVNIFLFRATPNAAARNSNLPTRRADGSVRARAETALDLHYILTFYGNAAKLEPERLMGAVAIALEGRPELDPNTIEVALNAYAAAQGLPIIAKADLPKARSRVRIAPETVSLEEFGKIWSIFFQVPYGLSCAYVCSHVVVESEDRIGDPLPVARGDIYVAPMGASSLHWAGPGPAGPGPLSWGGTLHLAGTGLGKPGTSLRIGDIEVEADPARQAEKSLQVTLDAALLGSELKAGVHVVQVVAPPPAVATPSHLRRRSNAVVMALHPSISVPPAAVVHDGEAERTGTVKIDFSPPVQDGQEVTLTLDARTPGGPRGVLLDPKPPAAFPAGQLVFGFQKLPKAVYLARAHVDGFASLPTIEDDPNSSLYREIVGPEVDLVP
jgi:hypothetical protein